MAGTQLLANRAGSEIASHIVCQHKRWPNVRIRPKQKSLIQINLISFGDSCRGNRRQGTNIGFWVHWVRYIPQATGGYIGCGTFHKQPTVTFATGECAGCRTFHRLPTVIFGAVHVTCYRRLHVLPAVTCTFHKLPADIPYIPHIGCRTFHRLQLNNK